MIALDTNVIVRVITADDLEQLRVALRVMEEPQLWLSKTVLLETEWVLRYSYRLEPSQIYENLRSFLGLPNVQVEDRTVVLRALTAFASGLDFADALHLYSSGESLHFATFDRKLAQHAPQDGPEVILLSY